ncbi:MAG: formate/nitrite transporter family protein [Treponema sp.]|jgi:nitrite transporter NirC|nr:formate/nitrite transporter family protein [Treponema sp.]
MISEEYKVVGIVAQKKINFYKNEKIAYFISSMMAGIYVGLCMVTILVMAGAFDNFAGIKILQGVSFAAALSLVVFGGAELFTGNVFVMIAGGLQKTIKPFDGVKLCVFCYLGNLAGSILIAALFLGTGYLQGPVLEAAHAAMYTKTNPYFLELFVRGILCNMLVCAAVWCMFRLQSEGSKLVMIFWCIYLFVVCGFEHSIANMTLFSMETMAGVDSFTFGRILINLAATTTGNIFGGAALSMAYWSIARKSL